MEKKEEINYFCESFQVMFFNKVPNEPHREKTCLHMRKQRCRSAAR